MAYASARVHALGGVVPTASCAAGLMKVFVPRSLTGTPGTLQAVPDAQQATASFSYLLGKLRAPQPVPARALPAPARGLPALPQQQPLPPAGSSVAPLAPGPAAARAAPALDLQQIPTPCAPQLPPYSLPASAAAAVGAPAAALLGAGPSPNPHLMPPSGGAVASASTASQRDPPPHQVMHRTLLALETPRLLPSPVLHKVLPRRRRLLRLWSCVTAPHRSK